MDHRKLIAALSSGEFKSGVELADAMSVSRTAVWKNLKLIEEKGIALQKTKGKGYRIKGGLELLNKALIVEKIREANIAVMPNIELLDVVTSTNEYLLSEVCPSKPGVINVVLSEAQTDGRARRGRNWVSPYGANLYLSVGFFSVEPITAFQGLSLAVGVMVADALVGLGVHDVRLKWPNDLYVGSRKLGGILIDLRGQLDTGCMAVIGLGVNVNMDQNNSFGLDEDLWCSLRMLGAECGRNGLAAAIIESICRGLEDFLEGGFDAFYHRWNNYDWLKGSDVEVLGAQLVGRAAGVTRQGLLVVQTNGVSIQVSSGDVSVRKKDVIN